MIVDCAVDLEILFADFGVEAIIGMERVTVLFNAPSKQVGVFDGMVISTAPTCVMRSAEVDANEVSYDTMITIGNGDYLTNEPEHDGAGFALIELRTAP